MRVLVVEDDLEIQIILKLHLSKAGFELVLSTDVPQALKALEGGKFDLIVLDWMLPGQSGIDFLYHLRSSLGKKDIPVLMLTAKADPENIVEGLEKGADDYLTKPFDFAVLTARAKALVRRYQGVGNQSQDPILTLGDVKISVDSHQVTQGKELIHLTPYEFKLLLGLVQGKGKVLTREQLIGLVQGDGISVIDRAIDTHVFGLRKKLGDSGRLIETVRGVGYRIHND